MYETLFGIPGELAMLKDALFEIMRDAPDKAAWPIRFVEAVPVGADLDSATGRWISAMLSDDDSQLTHVSERPEVASARRCLETGRMDQDLELAARINADSARRWNVCHTADVADTVLSYTRRGTEPEAYTTEDMYVLRVVSQAARPYSARGVGGP